MRVFDSNWMQIADYLQRDDRIVLPVGSTEQHGYLSLGTDALLAERVSVEAAEPLGVPVLPVLPFGMAPYFVEYPGSMSLRMSTYIEVIRDLLDCLASQGFRRIAVINGHGGNAPVSRPHPRMGVRAARRTRGGAVPQLVQRPEDGGGGVPVRRRPVSRLLAGELRLDQGHAAPRSPAAARLSSPGRWPTT